jgi:hypothetical protein
MYGFPALDQLTFTPSCFLVQGGISYEGTSLLAVVGTLQDAFDALEAEVKQGCHFDTLYISAVPPMPYHRGHGARHIETCLHLHHVERPWGHHQESDPEAELSPVDTTRGYPMGGARNSRLVQTRGAFVKVGIWE